MQVFAQKSVLVVSIYFPLIALISTEPRDFKRQLRRTRSDRSNECEIRT